MSAYGTRFPRSGHRFRDAAPSRAVLPREAGSQKPLARRWLWGLSVDIPKTPRKKRGKWLAGGAVVLVLTGATAGLSQVRGAAPTVERGTVWVDTVHRGPMLRQVKGPGTLVPEHIRWLTANTGGRVESLLVRPGATVEADTVILELSNPDVQLQALEAERQLAAAEADLLRLRTEQENQRLAQEAALATLQTDAAEAARRVQSSTTLASKSFIATSEMQHDAERHTELQKRLTLEKQRLAVMETRGREQLAAQQEQIGRLRAVVEFRRKQVASLKVRAGETGVLQELPMQLGQWVVPGTVMAKVVRPELLKAELRIPEAQARDVAPGQPAEVDTHNGVAKGAVVRVAPAASQGTVLVEVALSGELPKGARPDLSVEGTVEVERLAEVLSVGRPVGAQPDGTLGLFRLAPGSSEASRVQVRIGRTSVNSVEVLGGLAEGDQVVLSDMTAWDAVERVKLQ